LAPRKKKWLSTSISNSGAASLSVLPWMILSLPSAKMRSSPGRLAAKALVAIQVKA
jgi:hypothetical protein